MIDVTRITNFNCSNDELEELILFWILAAGKNGKMAAVNLEKMLTILRQKYGDQSPFALIRSCGVDGLPGLMRQCGIGCYNIKSNTIWSLVISNIDLRKCSCYDLEQIRGIGRKTSRGLILHSRPDAKCAVIDTHLLKYLRGIGYSVKLTPPASQKIYDEITQLFISVIPVGFSIQEFDLLVWRVYSGN